MQNSDYWTVKAGNKALTCLETILNPHTPGYHTNWPAWKRQIAGFGWEWQSQILHLALPWCSQGHGRQNTNLPWSALVNTLPTLPCGNPSIQRTRKKQEGRPCISFFVCLRKGWASTTQSGGKRLSAVPPRAILLQLSSEKREGWRKKGKSLLDYYSWYRLSFLDLQFPNSSFHSSSADKCQSKSQYPGLSAVQTIEDLANNGFRALGDSGRETIVAKWLCQCVVLF